MNCTDYSANLELDVETEIVLPVYQSGERDGGDGEGSMSTLHLFLQEAGLAQRPRVQIPRRRVQGGAGLTRHGPGGGARRGGG